MAAGLGSRESGLILGQFGSVLVADMGGSKVGRGFTVEFNPVLGIGMPEGTVKCEFQYEENSDADPRIGSVLWGRPAHKK